MITVDRFSARPLTDQIVEQFIRIVKSGTLAAGSRLPSIRQFADSVGVSTYTVVVAYDRLVALGAIVSQASSGFFVAHASRAHPQPLSREVDAHGPLDALWLMRSNAEADAEWVTAGSGALPLSWSEELNQVTLVPRLWRSTTQHKDAPAQGLVSLREALSTYLGREKIFVDPANILTASGATQALDLICRAMLAPGDCVVVENPTYPMLLSRLRQERIAVLAVPRGPDGIDMAALERLCAQRVPKLVFTQSAMHNPTGFSATLGNNYRLLSLAERYGFLIAEDDTCGDLVRDDASRLAQLSAGGNVIYYRSFGKAMGPWVRVGFVVAAPALIERLLRCKIHSVASCSRIDERVVLEMLHGGRYRKYTERLAQRLGAARVSALNALRNSGLRLGPQGQGMFIWAGLGAEVDADRLVREAYQQKILLAPGVIFCTPPGPDAADLPDYASYLRLNAAVANNHRLLAFLAGRLHPVSTASPTMSGETAQVRDSGLASNAPLVARRAGGARG